MPECIFCRVAAGEARAGICYEDDQCVVFEDIHPQASVHLLVIPRRHIASLNEAAPEDAGLLGHLLVVAARVAGQRGIDGAGYRVVINTNRAAGQSVYHLHLHLLGGRNMRWPPG